jgi:hypothetical protein
MVPRILSAATERIGKDQQARMSSCRAKGAIGLPEWLSCHVLDDNPLARKGTSSSA